MVTVISSPPGSTDAAENERVALGSVSGVDAGAFTVTVEDPPTGVSLLSSLARTPEKV